MPQVRNAEVVRMSGPVQRLGGVEVEVDPADGRFIHRFRQSTLGELDECPERGRLVLTNQMPRIETDAAAVGTAVHAGIEAMLGGKGLAAAWEMAFDTFALIAQSDNFVWAKYRPDQVEPMIRNCLVTFEAQLLPDLDPAGVEIPFDDVFLHEDDERVIYLNGTIDYFDKSAGAWDWKTSGDERKYKQGFGGESWKLDRWNIQGPTYTKALVALGFLDPEGPWDFTFGAFVLPGGKLQTHTLQLVPAHHSWLAAKCMGWAKLIEAELDEWPTTDNQALCSPKWCPVWEQCKGKHFGDDWPIKGNRSPF